MKLLLSCEHAFNTIPQPFESYFTAASEILDSHRGYDPGAYDLFRYLEPLSDFSIHQEIGRLLIETNRSLHHASLFSEFSRKMSSEEKEQLISSYYESYRNRVEEFIEDHIAKSEILHLSVHSFTPVWKGQERNAEIGILYDPSRLPEKEYANLLRQQLKALLPQLRIRRNYPYLGKSDGLTTYLRKKFPEKYLGIELEVNQKLVRNNTFETDLKMGIYRAVEKLLK